MSRRGGVQRRRLHANPIERQDQHAVLRQSPDRHRRRGHVLDGRHGESPLRERDPIEMFDALPDVRVTEPFRQPRRVERRVVGAFRSRRDVVGQIGIREHTGPERARRGRGRSSVFLHLEAHHRHGEIPRGAAIGHGAKPPVSEGAESDTRQDLESFEALRRIVHPQPEHEGAASGIEVTDDVVQIRDATFSELEQRGQEPLGPRDFFTDDRFPQRADVVAPTLRRLPCVSRPGRRAGRDDTVPVNTDAFGEHAKGRRRTLVQMRDERRVVGEKLQRLVVQRRQAVADQGRLTVRDDRGDELVGCDAPPEDRVAPDFRAQWHGHEIETRRIAIRCRPDRPSPLIGCRQSLQAFRMQKRGRGWIPCLEIEHEARHFGDEAAAIGDRIDTERACEGDGAAGHRKILNNGVGRGETDRDCRGDDRA